LPTWITNLPEHSDSAERAPNQNPQSRLPLFAPSLNTWSSVDPLLENFMPPIQSSTVNCFLQPTFLLQYISPTAFQLVRPHILLDYYLLEMKILKIVYRPVSGR